MQAAAPAPAARRRSVVESERWIARRVDAQIAVTASAGWRTRRACRCCKTCHRLARDVAEFPDSRDTTCPDAPESGPPRGISSPPAGRLRVRPKRLRFPWRARAAASHSGLGSAETSGTFIIARRDRGGGAKSFHRRDAEPQRRNGRLSRASTKFVHYAIPRIGAQRGRGKRWAGAYGRDWTSSSFSFIPLCGSASCGESSLESQQVANRFARMV